MSFCWTEAREQLLVELWEERPNLYNVELPAYSNKHTKERSLNEMRESLGCSVKQLKQHMDSLRTSFGRLNKTPPSGSGAKKISARGKWILANLVFLGPFIKHRSSTSNLDDDEEEDKESEDEPQSEEEEENNVPDQAAASKIVVHADVHRSADVDEENSQLIAAKSEELNDELADITPAKRGKIGSMDAAEVIKISDSDVAMVGSADEAQMTRKSLPKRPHQPKGPPKKLAKARGKGSKLPDMTDDTNFISTVSSTIENLSSKLMTITEENKKSKDEIDVCIEGIEVKLRSIKRRENRLRLIDGLERMASAYVLDDCLSSERSSSQIGNVGYFPAGVQSISPPQNYYYGVNSQNPMSQQYFSSSQQGMSAGMKYSTSSLQPVMHQTINPVQQQQLSVSNVQQNLVQQPGVSVYHQPVNAVQQFPTINYHSVPTTTNNELTVSNVTTNSSHDNTPALAISSSSSSAMTTTTNAVTTPQMTTLTLITADVDSDFSRELLSQSAAENSASFNLTNNLSMMQ